MDLLALIVPAVIWIVAFLAFGFVLSRLYVRAYKDRAYVRTGFRGQKVIVDGGALVLPVFQSITWVNLQTLRLEVRRQNEDAMITRDKLRVDIGVEFYVRVKNETSMIALAAQTLGDRTNDANKLRELIEAKFVDALRAVAAGMDLYELQEKRAEFVKKVQETVQSDLAYNGLELESASLTKLDQTDRKYFNPNNAFDAEGLARLTVITEQKKRERNEVERNTEVAIEQQNLTAKQQTLALQRQGKEAELEQERDIANKTAATRAEKAQKEATARLAEENARIAAELAIKQKDIEAKREQETLDIGRQRDVALADQERQIAVADKSREESVARAKAEEARAQAVAAQERVETARAAEIAERERTVEVIAARQEAERDAAKLTIAAEAERKAAEDHAEATRIAARADADAVNIKADAAAREYEVRAEGERKLNEARNTLDPKIIELEITRERLRIIPAALAEAVKPLEKIGDVKIIDLGGGMPFRNASGATAGASDSLLNALLAYRAQSPIVDKLLSEAGITGGANPVEALVSTLTGVAHPKSGNAAGGEPIQVQVPRTGPAD